MSQASAVGRPRPRDAAPLFAALGDRTRLRLVLRFSADGPGSTTRPAARSAVSRQAVSKHRRVLSDAGLVRSTRRGRERIWELEPSRLADAHAYLDHISLRWDRALERLRCLVEE